MHPFLWGCTKHYNWWAGVNQRGDQCNPQFVWNDLVGMSPHVSPLGVSIECHCLAPEGTGTRTPHTWWTAGIQMFAPSEAVNKLSSVTLSQLLICFLFPFSPNKMPTWVPMFSADNSSSATKHPTILQLYEIDDNPKRKEFLDELFAFMQKRGTPINRLPIMAKQVLDLYELYNLVVARGGLVEVINKKQWQEIIKGLGLPSSITSAAFTLRTQ